jgi:ABC-type branched-subunit amino acid transport system permease subunit
MGRRRTDAVTASVLGGLTGSILGGGLGGLAGWLFATRAAANSPQEVAIIYILNTIVFWASIIIGTGAGAHFGAIIGAMVGVGIAARPEYPPASEDESSYWKPE